VQNAGNPHDERQDDANNQVHATFLVGQVDRKGWKEDGEDNEYDLGTISAHDE